MDTRGHRFTALATLPLNDPKASVVEFERVLGMGFTGCMLMGNVNGTSLADRRFWPLWERASDAGAVMYIHPTFPLGVEAMQEYWLMPLVGLSDPSRRRRPAARHPHADRATRRRLLRPARSALRIAEHRFVRVRPAVGRALREPRNGFHPSGNERAALAGLDRVESHPRGLQRRRAVSVHRGAGQEVVAQARRPPRGRC